MIFPLEIRTIQNNIVQNITKNLSLNLKITERKHDIMSKILLNSLISQNVYNISINPLVVTSVRWRRKPRWLPVAKSKMFRVPERKIIPEDEKLEFKRLFNNYR
jgi:hypothetical protein